jgi:hypothetical protein
MAVKAYWDLATLAAEMDSFSGKATKLSAPTG